MLVVCISCVRTSRLESRVLSLRAPRRRFAGAEGVSTPSQIALNGNCVRMCAAEHASRDPFCLLERRRGFAEIVERGVGVRGERLRVKQPHPEREILILSK